MVDKNLSGSHAVDAEAPESQRIGKEKRFSFAQLFSFLGSRPNANLRSDLSDALTMGGDPADSSFSAQERLLLNNILRLREARVEDIMIPRSEVEAVELQTPLCDLLQHFEKTGHSRMPVYVETLDDPRGMVHMRDVLNYLTRTARQAVGSQGRFNFSQLDLQQPLERLNLVRDVLFVPASMMASQLLTRMQVTRTQMALVIDEYGGTDGLVSLEDVVEIIVGEIEDEHDDVTRFIIQEAENKWLIDARAELADVVDTLGPDFVVGDLADEVHTIGGFLVAGLDRIPSKGEVLEPVPGFRFRILEADKRRIKRVRVLVSVAERS